MARNPTRAAALAVVLTLTVLAVGAFAYIHSGAYNVAATQDHTDIGRWILHLTQERSVAVRASELPEPPPADSTQLAHGFEHYREMCVQCHGAPGVERGEIGEGITPTPPDLSEEAGEMSTRELFWVTKYGLKLAGMPAFGRTHSDEEIRGIAAFVESLPA